MIGGVFSFGDAAFRGSTGGIRLNQPIVGIARYRTGTGYTMVASHGGIFTFGGRRFFGSLPGIGAHVSDVVGMAQTANGLGYWIVRRGGQVYAFGNALAFRPDFASPCDPVVAIIGNPTQQGFRLVTLRARPSPGASASPDTSRSAPRGPAADRESGAIELLNRPALG